MPRNKTGRRFALIVSSSLLAVFHNNVAEKARLAVLEFVAAAAARDLHQ